MKSAKKIFEGIMQLSFQNGQHTILQEGNF